MRNKDFVQPAEVNCTGKDKHVSLSLANEIASRMAGRHDRNIRSYKCPHCGFYHVGEVVRKRGRDGRPKQY